MFSGTGSIISMNESNLVFSVGIGNMSISVEGLRFGTEESNDELVGLDLLLKGGAGDEGGWWS